MELTEQTRQAVDRYIKTAGKKPSEFLFAVPRGPEHGMSTIGGPSFLPLSMTRIGIRSADLPRAGDFYSRLYGTEVASAASGRSRLFGLGDSALELISGSTNSSPGIDYIRITIKDFNAEAVKRVLGERGIAMSDSPGLVRIADPDGIGIELAAPS